MWAFPWTAGLVVVRSIAENCAGAAGPHGWFSCWSMLGEGDLRAEMIWIYLDASLISAWGPRKRSREIRTFYPKQNTLSPYTKLEILQNAAPVPPYARKLKVTGTAFLGYPMFKRSKVVEVCWIKIPVSVEVVHPGDVSKPLSDEQNAAVRFHSMANGRPVWHGEWGWWIVFSFFHYLVVRIQRSYAVKWGAKELLRVS